MHQIYYDTETTGSSTAFDSITEIYLSLNDENFQELENLHLRCRLKEGVIPNLNALLQLSNVSISIFLGLIFGSI